MMDRASSEIRATPAIVEVEPPSGGFDWGDAGIGAGVLFALMLTLGGASLAVRHSGSQRGGTAAA